MCYHKQSMTIVFIFVVYFRCLC